MLAALLSAAVLMIPAATAGSKNAEAIGRNASAGTDALMQAEILSYSRSRGLFAGVNLKGVVIRPEDDLNVPVYNKSARELLADDGKDSAHETAGLPTFSQTVARYSTASAADEKSARK